MLGLFRISSRVEDLEKAVRQLQLELKFYKDEFEKLEIKALESRKVYAKKLKRLTEVEEMEGQDDKNGLNSVLLPER